MCAGTYVTHLHLLAALNMSPNSQTPLLARRARSPNALGRSLTPIPCALHARLNLQPFFDRLAAHVQRANASMGCTCGRCGAPGIIAFSGKRQFAELFSTGGRNRGTKRQRRCEGPIGNSAVPAPAQEPGSSLPAGREAGAGGEGCGGGKGGPRGLLQAGRPSRIEFGRQQVLPAGWPLDAGTTEVWVMSSTSGAAAMTGEVRLASWRALAAHLAGQVWPRDRARCTRFTSGEKSLTCKG
jgi:hypothetical protein